MADSDEDFIFYLLLRVVELFYNEYNRFPGESNEMLDSDVALLKRVLNSFLNEHRVQNFSIKEEYIHEM